MKALPPEFGDKPAHECGVMGIYAPGRDVARLSFFALFALQHRGQEAAGIAVSDGHDVRMHRGGGLVAQVFTESDLAQLPGHMSVGHTRYSTSGGSGADGVQPIYCQSVVGDVAVAHNGNLVNPVDLRARVTSLGLPYQGNTDSEAIARLYAFHLEHGPIESARRTMVDLVGAYSVVVLTPRHIVAFRDPHGLRPLVLGRLGDGWVVASESCAFGPVGATFEREIEPGEVVLIDESGITSDRMSTRPQRATCLFEFIYFARPDSYLDGSTVYAARSRMGETLAREHPVEADLVVPVPDSGFPAALGYSKASGIPVGEGLIKSRYIHRTFIEPDPSMRERGVRLKLSPLPDAIRDKRLVLVDDSIVRSTTMRQIVRLLKEAGAKEVHVRITAPPIISPCFYGVDFPTKSELAAANFSIDAIRRDIGAESLGYLSVTGTAMAVGRPMRDYCLACFTGQYPIPVPENMSKEVLMKSEHLGSMASVDTAQRPLPGTE